MQNHSVGHDAAAPPNDDEPGPASDAAGDFALLKTRLKQELLSSPHDRNFRPVKLGESDYDACFRDWWFVGVRERGGDFPDEPFVIVTEAADVRATRLGRAKYSVRLARLAHQCIRLIPARVHVEFEIRQRETDQEAA